MTSDSDLLRVDDHRGTLADESLDLKTVDYKTVECTLYLWTIGNVL